METKIILQINNCQKLYKIDTSLSLKEIIEQICEDNNLVSIIFILYYIPIIIYTDFLP